MNIDAQIMWKTIFGSARLADSYGQTAYVPPFFKRAVIMALYDVDPLERKQRGEILQRQNGKRLWEQERWRWPQTFNCRCYTVPLEPPTLHLVPKAVNLHKPPDCSNCPGCPVCDGGLSYCVVCHGGESDLPSECPGRAMTAEEHEGVSNGVLDFINGIWKESTK